MSLPVSMTLLSSDLAVSMTLTEPVRYKAYQTSNLLGIEPIKYRTQQTLNLPETELTRYRTFQLSNRTDNEPI